MDRTTYLRTLLLSFQMRRSASRVWALSFALTLAMLTALAWQHRPHIQTGSGMSAPSIPHAAMGAPVLVTTVQEHSTFAAPDASLSAIPRTLPRQSVLPGFESHAVLLVSYAPLNRRPPPSRS